MFSIREALEATRQLLLQFSLDVVVELDQALNEGKTFAGQKAITEEILRRFYEQTGVAAKTDGNLALFDYDSIRVNWSEPYGWVCRGLILDPMNAWAVVAFGLAKFFNDGEIHAHPIDWSTVRCFEKLDGSMVQRYWNPYTQQFEFSTRFQLHQDLAQNMVSNTSDMTWLDLINACIKGQSYAPFEFNQPKNETWVLECMSPLNRIVVQHRSFDFKFTARRNIDTLREESLDIFPQNKVPFVMHFKDSAETLAIASEAEGTELEGFVVVDKDYNRVKIKNPKYIALHRLKGGVNSVGAVINLAKSGDDEEITVHFPEFLPAFNKAKAAIAKLIQDHSAALDELEGIESQKEFALALKARNLPCPNLCFVVRAGKEPSIKAALYAMRENAFIDLVKSQLPSSFLYECMLPPVQTKNET